MKLSAKQRKRLQRMYYDLFIDCFDYNEEHLAFLKSRRDAYINSLR